ncbi:MAG: ATPase [Rhodobacteraceae bacterium]|jgi:F-type H+-transporting ATPase subunit epsilon|nr:ATPase [Paracoccaceae bacterium]
MQLDVILPERKCLSRTVCRIVAEAPDGHFGLLPGHGDFVTQLVPGILECDTPDGQTSFVAVHAGTLLKCGERVRIAVENALVGDDLDLLRDKVESWSDSEIDEDRAARTALARLEAGMIRRFRDLESPLS